MEGVGCQGSKVNVAIPMNKLKCINPLSLINKQVDIDIGCGIDDNPYFVGLFP